MHEHQRNRRIAAAKAFMESLDQLQDILAQEQQAAESESQLSSDSVSKAEPSGSALLQNPEYSATSWANSKVLEEAAADLDEFFGESQLSAEGELGEES